MSKSVDGITRTRTARTVALGVVAAFGLAACTESAKVPPNSVSSASASAPASAITATGAPSAGSSGLASGAASAAAPAPARVSSTPVPVRVSIPAIHVSSDLQMLGLDGDGALEPPAHWQEAGWYAGGVRPGDLGPAVIAGHVDSVSGPAVFYRLDQLRAGDAVIVTLENHAVRTFRVDTIREYPKRTFPTTAVYGSTAVPTLRLVTCTGDFDAAKHSYVDNLVVSAHLSS